MSHCYFVTNRHTVILVWILYTIHKFISMHVFVYMYIKLITYTVTLFSLGLPVYNVHQKNCPLNIVAT